jgi:prephenate dehydratase
MRFAIQGELGSFSHEAASIMDPEATILPCAVSAEVFRLVENGEASAVIPIENSLAGSVTEHFDLLFQHDARIERESLLRIRHNLIVVPGTTLDTIQRVFSHPVALAQCRRFFLEHPQMRPTPSYDTAGSVKQLIETGDSTSGAIASGQAALCYGGEVLMADIEDNPANFTRFLLIRRGSSVRPRPDFDKVSVAFTVENRPGTLVSALQIFSENDANLCKIESRPVAGQPWEYVFYVDYKTLHAAAADAILHRLQRECLVVKELGRYPAASVPGA